MEYRDPAAVVSTEWLEAHLEDADLRIFDCTVYLRPVATDAGVPYPDFANSAWIPSIFIFFPRPIGDQEFEGLKQRLVWVTTVCAPLHALEVAPELRRAPICDHHHARGTVGPSPNPVVVSPPSPSAWPPAAGHRIDQPPTKPLASRERAVFDRAREGGDEGSSVVGTVAENARGRHASFSNFG